MQEQNLDHNIGKYHKQQHMHDLILGKRDTILYQAWKLAFVIRLTFHRTLLGTIFLAGITFLPLILKGIRFSFLFVNAFHNLSFFHYFSCESEPFAYENYSYHLFTSKKKISYNQDCVLQSYYYNLAF